MSNGIQLEKNIVKTFTAGAFDVLVSSTSISVGYQTDTTSDKWAILNPNNTLVVAAGKTIYFKCNQDLVLAAVDKT